MKYAELGDILIDGGANNMFYLCGEERDINNFLNSSRDNLKGGWSTEINKRYEDDFYKDCYVFNYVGNEYPKCELRIHKKIIGGYQFILQLFPLIDNEYYDEIEKKSIDIINDFYNNAFKSSFQINGILLKETNKHFLTN